MADTSLNRQRFPEMFEFEKGQIDRRTCRRVVPMEVLALGLPRTGTACKPVLSSSNLAPSSLQRLSDSPNGF